MQAAPNIQSDKQLNGSDRKRYKATVEVVDEQEDILCKTKNPLPSKSRYTIEDISREDDIDPLEGRKTIEKPMKCQETPTTRLNTMSEEPSAQKIERLRQEFYEKYAEIMSGTPERLPPL